MGDGALLFNTTLEICLFNSNIEFKFQMERTDLFLFQQTPITYANSLELLTLAKTLASSRMRAWALRAEQ